VQPILSARYSLVVPVYRNEGSIASLVGVVAALHGQLQQRLEVIFVVDGSPDASYTRLCGLLPDAGVPAKVIVLSRNFGSFAAIREGLLHASGDYAAVMAADLQEPPELVTRFFHELDTGEVDVVFGQRESRDDPWASKLASGAFWWIYRRFVQTDVPPGGVDVFAVNRRFLDRLVAFEEANGSLLGLLFWMGGRRRFVSYARRERQHGKSAWTLRKKFTYLLDSVFAFTDAPIRVLLGIGLSGLVVSGLLGAVVLVAKLGGVVAVPGYAGTMLAVLFFGGLNALGLGLVGNYAWRAYENTKRRPLSIPMLIEDFPARPGVPAEDSDRSTP
jgi:glycosyltransferase involved in cell wall biosynthesis